MKRFRKLPVEVEAVEITDATFDAPHPNPEHIESVTYDPVARCVLIDTIEGPRQVGVGWWLIRGVVGELYPCRSDVFAMTYEPVE
jgi:hypothetical protein